MKSGEQSNNFPNKRLVIVLAIAWLVATGWVVLGQQQVTSPDEAGNRFFIQQLAQHGRLSVAIDSESAQFSYAGLRMALVDDEGVKPAGFLGLVLIGGTFERIFSEGSSRLVTPLLAVFGLWALFTILRRFWGPALAWLGTILVALHPVWFQFQTLPYFHNGAFASMVLIASWRLLRVLEKSSLVNGLWFGLAYGAALFLRPIEVLWTGPLILIVLLAQRHWKPLLAAVVVTIITQLPWLLVNLSIYGSIFSSGYAPSGTIVTGSVNSSILLSLAQLVTPPGGWSWNWISSFWEYLILLVPTWSMAALVALWFYARRVIAHPLKVFKLSLLGLSLVYLLVYYGSWDLYPLEPATNVGSLASYARYWIPVYVGMVVGVLWLLKRLTAVRWVMILVTAGLLVSQSTMLLAHQSSGLIARIEQDQEQQERKQLVLRLSAPNSAIVAGHMDKVLWPDRDVSFRLPSNDQEWRAFEAVASKRPTFIYVTPRQYNLSEVNQQLDSIGFVIGERYQIVSDELWEVRPRS